MLLLYITVHRLSQAGTFAGNDAIVAFSRLHNVSVVIHQLNSPAWIIHPSKDSQDPSTGREVHIFYHNGDHYNSVRRVGDDSESPTNIKLNAHTQVTHYFELM
jgi:OTU domain-containing protein 3